MDIMAIQEIKLTKKRSLFVGYKWAYSKDRYEFWKAKTKIGHGPYINFRLKF